MRERDLDLWRSIQTLRSILKVVKHPLSGAKNWGMDATATIGEVRDDLRRFRKRLRIEQSPKTFVEKIKAEIERDTSKAIDKVMERRNQRRTSNPLKHSTNILTNGKSKVDRGSNGSLWFYLRRTWYRNVYKKLLVGDRFQNANLFPLRVTEFKTNAKGVRLFSADVFNFMTNKEVHGYIAQSKLDDKCVFNLTVGGAIAAATNLTLSSVNEKLGVKDNDNG